MHTIPKLPQVGDDWIEGFTGKYIILSLKHSQPDALKFWKPKCLGYTLYLFEAGIYTHDQVSKEPTYYNDGSNSIAIPLTRYALQKIDLHTMCDLTTLATFMNHVP